ncbi:MAG: aminoacetone oxidase family FAD-binding enzyme [Deltaproteobacteria bacterium]|nr:aminoacetone oxidase family FAD-binding enzyme [Deltaproteobacteria bacterium]
MKNRNGDIGHSGQVVVIGAGAAGMLAAGRAAEAGARVLLLEKMDQPGRKILISGKTRCNLTNTRTLREFIAMYGPNGPFLHAAFHRFFRDDLLDILHRYGVETKEERGGRIFPVSDRAADVVGALRRYVDDQGVKLATQRRVFSLAVRDGKIAGVTTDSGLTPAAAVIVAAGGATWPATGSTGDGYKLAKAVGHRIEELRPALVPLIVKEIGLAKSMQGVSLRNVRLTAFRGRPGEIDPAAAPSCDIGRGLERKKPRGSIIESRFGEMMITHFGIGGPVTLLISLAVVDALAQGPVSVAIDLKAALDYPQLRARLQRDLDAHGKRQFKGILEGLLPRKMIEPLAALTGIPLDKPAHQVTAAEREQLAGVLKSLRFEIAGPLPMAAAIVTAGGVSLKEIDPRTMASRLVQGLYFCGEVLDIDADTGGFNLQAAFSTGYVAGEAAAAYVTAIEE